MEIYFKRNEKPRRGFRGAEAPDTIYPSKNIFIIINLYFRKNIFLIKSLKGLMEIYFKRNEKPRRGFRGAEAPDTIDPSKNLLTL
jgi:hypothetical protein